MLHTILVRQFPRGKFTKFKISSLIWIFLLFQFMKKSKDKEDKEKEIEESSALFSDHITDEMKSAA